MDESQLFERLTDFFGELQSAGYELGCEQLLAVHCLLTKLAANGELPVDPACWRTLIAPVLCNTPWEQEDFGQRFDSWVQSHRQVLPAPPPAVTAVIEDATRTHRRIRIARRVSVGVAVTCVLVWGILQFPRIRPPTPNKIPEPRDQDIAVKREESAPGLPDFTVFLDPAPLREQNLVVRAELPAKRGASLPLYIFVPAVGLILAGVGWQAWKRRRDTVYLERHRAKRPESLLTIAAHRPTQDHLYQSLEFEKIGRRLRNRRAVESNRLHVDRTISKTIRSAGYFRAATRTILVVPEYLVIVHRQSQRDHWAELADTMVARLRKAEVHVTRFDFREDPRRCVACGSNGPPISLEELAGRFSDHRLILCCETSRLIDPFTGAPAAWTSQFDAWSNRVILTPTSLTEWGYQEWKLHEAGFIVLPYGLPGIEAMPDWFVETVGRREIPWDVSPRLPAVLRRREINWLSANPPPEAQRRQLMDELKVYLGADGFRWLASLAVYPELNWHLTLYLGQLLNITGPLEKPLSTLARLPWLRHGKLPDWLRTSLLDQLTPDELSQVRFGVDRMLLEATLENSGGDVEFEFAWNQRHWLASLGKRVQEMWLKEVPDQDQLRDVVFARFVRGQSATRLSYRAPRQLQQMLVKQFTGNGKPRRRFAMIWLYARLATVLAALIVWGMYAWNKFTEPNPIPREVAGSVQVVGYGNDLRVAVHDALTDLEKGELERFVQRMFPVEELRYLAVNERMSQLLAMMRFQSDNVQNAGPPAPSLQATLIRDLAAITEHMDGGGQPSYNDERDVATFAFQRLISLDVPGGRGEDVKAASVLESPYRVTDLQREYASSQNLQLVAFQQPPGLNPDQSGFPFNSPFAPPMPPGEYETVVIKFQLSQGSWRFYNGAEQIRKLREYYLKENDL